MNSQDSALAAVQAELRERICANARRFEDPYYRIEGVFQAEDAAWPGDKEGRALLAFVSHYRISGKKIPCMEQMLAQMPMHTGEHLYFGPPAGKLIFEQQLSGHSWLLRGLCEHYEQFRDAFSMQALCSVTEHLYLPLRGRFHTYPTDRNPENTQGGVSGVSCDRIGDWKLSSDTGCAFMSIDGLSHVYQLTGDERVLALLREMIDCFAQIDKEGMRLQTHCTLTAARGMLRLYEQTKEACFLQKASDIMTLYVRSGMSATYQNLNWWGRPDSWTEPCAVVDSLMLAGELYRLCGETRYRQLAARIFANGFASAQRPNGGAGTDSIVLPGQPDLYPKMEEAFFCCSMRLAEGLRYAWEHVKLLIPQTEGCVKRDAAGRYHDGDLLYGELDGASAEAYTANAVTVDGHRLIPLLKYYRLPPEDAKTLRQRVLFDS